MESRIIEHSNETGHTPEQVHNSKLAINRVTQDILYYIFVLAVDGSSTPQRTALVISYVCRYWRKYALEWPVLWRLIDLDLPRPFFDLFMSRSGNAPLTLSWTHTPSCSSIPHVDSHSIRKIYSGCITDQNHVLSRLCSLTLCLFPSEFAQIRHVLYNPNVPPLQPRHLDIHLLGERPKSSPLADLMRVDPSCLQKLMLCSVDLPCQWLELFHNKLTHFKFWFPVDPPTVSHLLKFLSSCPLLCALELGISGTEQGKIDLDDAATTSVVRLDFPKLTQLTFRASDMTGYVYTRVLSTRIRTGTALSKFALDYDNRRKKNSLLRSYRLIPDITTRNIFEAIPSGALSNFTSHEFLHVTVDYDTFEIVSGPGNIHQWLPNPPLKVTGSFPRAEGLNSYSHLDPILDLIRSMPTITCLSLGSEAWRALSWIADIPKLFPCLDTLHLVNMLCDISYMLKCLPAGLKLNRLILVRTCIGVSVDGLLEMVSNAGVKLLTLQDISFHHKAQLEIVKTTLRQEGIAVVVL